MGVGMQVTYLGFAGDAQLEAEIGVQLLRLARFFRHITHCNLAIEATCDPEGHLAYEARMELFTLARGLIPVGQALGDDPYHAIRATFDAAERELERGVYPSAG